MKNINILCRIFIDPKIFPTLLFCVENRYQDSLSNIKNLPQLTVLCFIIASNNYYCYGNDHKINVIYLRLFLMGLTSQHVLIFSRRIYSTDDPDEKDIKGVCQITGGLLLLSNKVVLLFDERV